MFVNPVTDNEEKRIYKIKVETGYYHGQVDALSVSGIGAFFWNTGEFYFGEWQRGAQNVGRH